MLGILMMKPLLEIHKSFLVDIQRPSLGVKLLEGAVSRDADFISGLAMRRAVNVVDLMGLLPKLQLNLVLRRAQLVLKPSTNLILLKYIIPAMKTEEIFKRNYQEESYTHKEEMTHMALSDSESNLANYKRGLASVEEQLVFYRKNEVIFGDKIVVLKRDVSFKDSDISWLKSELEKVKLEKESYQLKIEKFENASKMEFQEPKFEGYGPKTSKSASEDIFNEVRKSNDAPLVEKLVSDDKSKKKIVFPTVAKIEVVKSKQQENPVRKPGNPETELEDSVRNRSRKGINNMSPEEHRTVLKYRLMIPLFPVDAICLVCRKACFDSFGEHAIHCKELSSFKYQHDMVSDVLFDVCRRARISAKK
ncbi:hypothetical protein Tco_0806509 [Tanacetum coccineum]